MPRLPKIPLKERKVQEEKRERDIQRVFRDRSKDLENRKREKNQRKKSVGELLCLIDTGGIDGCALQPANTYTPKSYNLDRQIVGLLNHLFARYPVPTFLYQACLKTDSMQNLQAMYRQWFITLAQGGSFPKLVKGYMTSKEAFVFLSAPATNHIHENVWWAKMKVAGLPTNLIATLIERIFSGYYYEDPNGLLAEVIRFYARYHQEMNKTTFGEITDFLAWKLRQDQTFSLKGRTITSVIKLANEWHVLMQKAKLGQNVEWKGLEMPAWEFETKDKIWTVVELHNNKELMNEGRKQKHCVYSYVHWCVAGRSAIFSMRSYRKQVAGYTEEGQVLWANTEEMNRITIEVMSSARTVLQVRGVLNRPPTDEEKAILRHWTGEKGLILRA